MTNKTNQLIHSFSASMDVTKYISSHIHTITPLGLFYVISITVRISNIGDASFFAIKIQAIDNEHVFAETSRLLKWTVTQDYKDFSKFSDFNM